MDYLLLLSPLLLCVASLTGEPADKQIGRVRYLTRYSQSSLDAYQFWLILSSHCQVGRINDALQIESPSFNLMPTNHVIGLLPYFTAMTHMTVNQYLQQVSLPYDSALLQASTKGTCVCVYCPAIIMIDRCMQRACSVMSMHVHRVFRWISVFRRERETSLL